MGSTVGLAVVVAALGLAACGEQSPAPDVTGERLDRAQATLDDAGLDAEVEDDTAFGVIDETNFTVCEQEPAPGEETGSVTLVVDRTCPDLNASTPTEEPKEPEPSGESCDSPEKVVCEAVEDVYGSDFLIATAFQQGDGLAISYSVVGDDEAKMEQLYERIFQSGVPIKYVGIAGFKPGDEPGADFPLIDTNVGADLYAQHQGEPFSSYWRVLSDG